MHKFFLAVFFGTLLCIQSHIFLVEASEASIQEYIELIRRYPNVIEPQGIAAKGEIEIVLDKEKMASIEMSTGRDVGIIAQDNYWIWINDACIFPNGYEGVYGRILWVKALESSPVGVVVMPMMSDGTVVLNCNFRHATRSWEIELPRGGINSGEEVETAARRETKEETGMIIDSLTLLGEVTPDTGLTSTVVPIFLAKVIEKQNAEQGDSEAIEEILFLSLNKIKQALVNGYYQHQIKGIEKRIYFRDPFLAYAVLMYELIHKQDEELEF